MESKEVIACPKFPAPVIIVEGVCNKADKCDGVLEIDKAKCIHKPSTSD